MTSDTDTVVLVERALDQTAAIIAAIPGGQAGLATPCPDWDVQALVRHLAGQDLRNFLVAARGATADWQAPADELGEDWAAQFGDRAAQLMAVWRAADLDRARRGAGRRASGVAQPRRSADHRAGRSWLGPGHGHRPAGRPDPALADHALSWARQMLRPEHRGPDRAFGPEVPVRPDGRSTSGWQAGSAATRNGHQQAARPITGPEPLLLARRPAL